MCIHISSAICLNVYVRKTIERERSKECRSAHARTYVRTWLYDGFIIHGLGASSSCEHACVRMCLNVCVRVCVCECECVLQVYCVAVCCSVPVCKCKCVHARIRIECWHSSSAQPWHVPLIILMVAAWRILDSSTAKCWIPKWKRSKRAINKAEVRGDVAVPKLCDMTHLYVRHDSFVCVT